MTLGGWIPPWRPWTRVAEAQGWLDLTNDVPPRVLVDVWPVLARNGVRPFEVSEGDTPMDVLFRAGMLLEAQCREASFWLETSENGRARVNAGIEVEPGGFELSWLLLDGVESLRWTCPRVFPVVLRAAAVLVFRCNLALGWGWDFAEFVDFDDDGPPNSEEICLTVDHGQRLLLDEMRGLSRPTDTALLLDEAERLGPGWFEVQDMAAQVALAAELLGDVWAIRSDEGDGGDWQEMFQVFFSHPVFLNWSESVFNDRVGNVGMSAPVITRRLSRFGRTGSLDAMRAEAARVRRGVEALQGAVAAINEITGVFDDWDDWYADVKREWAW